MVESGSCGGLKRRNERKEGLRRENIVERESRREIFRVRAKVNVRAQFALTLELLTLTAGLPTLTASFPYDDTLRDLYLLSPE